MPTRFLAAALLLALCLPAAALAQTPQPMPMPAGNAGSPMMQPMLRMQQTTAALPMGGTTDRQFASMMVPHHQAAIDMAKIELASGHDPQMRRLAQAIIAAQRREIGQMDAWLARHPQ